MVCVCALSSPLILPLQTRKIRCDSGNGGCTPCRQNNVKCTTVDRNTGRATARGYTEGLEHENRWLTDKVLEYEQRLKQAGISFKPALPDHTVPDEPTPPRRETSTGIVDPNIAQFSPYRVAHGDTYGSIPYNGPPLISFGKGTSLSCLGVEVDIEDYVPRRQHEADYTDWLQFWTVVFNRTDPVPEPRWPETQKDFETYAQWYFGSLNPYTPVLHKPDVYEWVRMIHWLAEMRKLGMTAKVRAFCRYRSISTTQIGYRQLRNACRCM